MCKFASMSTVNPRGMWVIFLVFLVAYEALGYSSPPRDDRYLDRELASPGGHQLASWLISQLRQSDIVIPEVQVPPYRLPLAGKRNSELTSSIMGIPRTMIDNGK